MRNLLSILILLGVGIAHAQEASSQGPAKSIYAFGPSCSSSGQSTQKASQAIQSLIGTITNLANSKDANCNGLSSLVNTLNLAQEQSTAAEQSTSDPVTGDTPSQAQSKMAALADVVMSPDQNMTPFVSGAQKLFTDEALRSAVGGYNSQDVSGKKGQTNATYLKAAKGRAMLYSGAARSISVSAQFLKAFSDSLPNYSSCLIGRHSELGTILDGLINAGAAFAGNGTGMSPATSGLIQSVSNLLVNQKFRGAIAQLDQVQLNQSMSCLLEVSTDSYCSTLDMQHLVKNPDLGRPSVTNPETGMQVHTNSTLGNASDYKSIVQANVKESKDYDRYGNTPISGYYILTVHMPNVYNWVQSVQFGVPANVETDADYKVQTEALVSAFKQKAIALPAVLQERITQINNLTDADSRKQALIAAITEITKHIGELNTAGPINFFTQTKSDIVLPFYLLDEENNIPSCVYSTSSGTTCDPIGTLQDPKNNFTRLNNFDSTYLNVVKSKLDVLISQATAKASNYYQSRVIVNSVNLAVDSLIGTNYSVKDSFEFISNYLAYLDKFISDKGRDDQDLQSVVYAIRDAQNRFDAILRSYDKLVALSKLDRTSPGYNQIVEDTYKNLINEVYNQFDILWEKDGYLVETLNNFVSAEYALRIKTGIGLENYDRQFLTISGKDLLEVLKSANFTNRVDISSDLSKAQESNLASIAAIDQVFLDSFYNTVQMYNLRLSGKDITQSTVNKMNLKALAAGDSSVKSDYPLISSACSVLGHVGDLLCGSILAPDKHPVTMGTGSLVMAKGDTSEGDYLRLRNTFCLQSLAFVRRDRFATEGKGKPGLCSGIVVKSDYWNQIPDDKKSQFQNLNANYDDLLKATQSGTSRQGVSQAICAYRNYRRNNMVYFLTKDADQRVSMSMSQRVQNRKAQDDKNVDSFDPDAALSALQKSRH